MHMKSIIHKYFYKSVNIWKKIKTKNYIHNELESDIDIDTDTNTDNDVDIDIEESIRK